MKEGAGKEVTLSGVLGRKERYKKREGFRSGHRTDRRKKKGGKREKCTFDFPRGGSFAGLNWTFKVDRKKQRRHFKEKVQEKSAGDSRKSNHIDRGCTNSSFRNRFVQKNLPRHAIDPVKLRVSKGREGEGELTCVTHEGRRETKNSGKEEDRRDVDRESGYWESTWVKNKTVSGKANQK